MNKTPAAMAGVSVQLGSERETSTRIRPILQATPLMALRLEALLYVRREVAR